MRTRNLWIAGFLAVPAVLGGATFLEQTDIIESSARDATAGFSSSSGPIQITSDDRVVWVANPDANSVTAIDVKKDANEKIAEVGVGLEPQNVAISPNGHRVYVSNTASGTVSVIRGNGRHPAVLETIRVGTEPYGIALTPNGSRLYVANARSNDVSVIDTQRN